MVSSEGDTKQNIATFRLEGEDFTLANALHHMLNRNPHVESCGYSAPHPSDDFINLKVQTTGGITPKQALKQAAIDVKKVCEHIKTEYHRELEHFQNPQ